MGLLALPLGQQKRQHMMEAEAAFILVTAGRESERQKRAEASFLSLKAHPDGLTSLPGITS